MSALSSNDQLLIEKLEAHLKAEGYSYQVRQRYPACARQFLQYCQRNALKIETARPLHIARFMRRHYRLFRKRRGEAPPPSPSHKWCHQYTGAINMLLRLVHGRWPLPASPSTAIEAFHCEIVHDYDVWLRDLRGLAPVTRTKRTIRALQFLSWLGPQADKDGLGKLSISHLDIYLQQRCAGFKRASVEDYVVCLRDFLRHLKRSGYVAGDLSEVIIGPRIYDHEGIPSALRAEEVTQVLEAAREDRSPGGLRDYAILILLAVYGLRAGEVVRLRLDDIVWRQDVLEYVMRRQGLIPSCHC
jgi:integrase